MTHEDFTAATTAKIQGTWNLHNVAEKQEHPLHFFTMLSSLSGLVGQRAQANYAAANAFLDSFAQYRRSCGLPAMSVDLGVVEDVGYIAERPELAARLDKNVWSAGINEAMLLKIIEVSIRDQLAPSGLEETPQIITGIPVPQPANSELVRDARFCGLVFGDRASAATGEGQGSHAIQEVFQKIKNKAQRAAILETLTGAVNEHVSKALSLPEPMEPGKDISSYGMDSLAAVEIRNWLRLELKAEMTTLEVTNAKSLYALCERVLDKMIAQ